MSKKSDNNVFSLRKKINTIIERISKDRVPFEEVDSAISQLQKLPEKHVTDILLKKLEGSNKDFFVANYILREIADEKVVEQIIKIVFESKLPDDKKAVLISLLDELDVDLEKLDLSQAFQDIESVGKIAVENFISELANGSLSMDKAVEWLYDVPEDTRFSFIDDLICSENDTALEFIGKLMRSDDLDLVKEIIRGLSKTVNPLVVSLFKENIDFIEDSETINLAERALRKLTFKGIQPSTKKRKIETKKTGEFYKAIITNIDGVGSQSLWLSRLTGKKLNCLFLLINEREGIKDCFGNKMTIKQFEGMIKQQESGGIIIREIAYDLALKLVCDAIFINKRSQKMIAPAFHFLREEIFSGEKLIPETYQPDFSDYDIGKIKQDQLLLAKTAEIVALVKETESWFVTNEKIYNFAEKLIKQKGGKKSKVSSIKEVQEIVRQNFCELIPEFERRLLFTADLINKTEKKGKKDKIKILLCAAHTLRERPEEHPFLLTIANKSLNQAQLSILNGLDFRKNPEYFS